MSGRYDFVMAGGGLAGRSLAYHLVQSDLSCSILIIDKDPKEQNDRTFCFWTNRPTLFDDLVYCSWGRLQFKSERFDGTIDLRDYAYKMIRGIDFYRFTESELGKRGNVEFVTGHVDGIEEDRVSAMSAAMLSLGERIAGELGRGYLDQVYIKGENGYVVLMSVGEEAVLTVLARKEAKLGLVFLDMRRCVEELTKIV